MAVLGRVPERFLRDAKQREHHDRVGGLDLAFGMKAHLNVILPLDLGAVRFEGGRETGVLQQIRVQVV